MPTQLDALARARRSDPTVDFVATILAYQPRLRWRLTTREMQQLARLLELWADARDAARAAAPQECEGCTKDWRRGRTTIDGAERFVHWKPDGATGHMVDCIRAAAPQEPAK